MRPKPFAVLLAAALPLSAAAPAAASDPAEFERDLAEKKANREKWETWLTRWRGTLTFVERMKPQDPNDVRIAREQVQAMELYLDRARKAEAAAQKKLEASQESAPNPLSLAAKDAVDKVSAAAGGKPPAGTPPPALADPPPGDADRGGSEPGPDPREQPPSDAAQPLSGAAAPIPPPDPGKAQSMAAMRKAAGLADALKRGLTPTDDGLAGGPGAGASASRTPGAASGAGAAPRPGAADPSSGENLALSWSSGYHGAFEKHGLKVGPGPDGRPAVLGADGRPATPEQLALLRETIRAEPRALMKRPDYYAVVPRETLADLKSDYRAASPADATRFKDVSLTGDERDFSFARSCEALSGDCNESVVEDSYKKGELLEPESLAAIDKVGKEKKNDGGWDDAESGWDERGFDGGAASSASAERPGLLALAERVGAWLGLSGEEPPTPAAAGAATAPNGAAGTASGAAAAHSPGAAVPSASERAESRRVRRGGAGAAGALLLAAAIWLARRKAA